MRFLVCFAMLWSVLSHAETTSAQIHCVSETENSRIQMLCDDGTSLISNGFKVVTCSKDGSGKPSCVSTELSK